MLLELLTLGSGHRSAGVQGSQFAGFFAVRFLNHLTRSVGTGRSRPRNRFMPNAIRVFAVPKGMPCLWAISKCVNPSKNAKAIAERCSSGRRAKAARSCSSISRRSSASQGSSPAVRDSPAAASSNRGRRRIRSTARAGDRGQPDFRTRPQRIIAIGRTPHLPERFLQHVFGIVAGAKNARQQSENSGRVPVVEFGKSKCVSRNDALDKLMIGTGHCRACASGVRSPARRPAWVGRSRDGASRDAGHSTTRQARHKAKQFSTAKPTRALRQVLRACVWHHRQLTRLQRVE